MNLVGLKETNEQIDNWLMTVIKLYQKFSVPKINVGK